MELPLEHSEDGGDERTQMTWALPRLRSVRGLMKVICSQAAGDLHEKASLRKCTKCESVESRQWKKLQSGSRWCSKGPLHRRCDASVAPHFGSLWPKLHGRPTSELLGSRRSRNAECEARGRFRSGVADLHGRVKPSRLAVQIARPFIRIAKKETCCKRTIHTTGLSTIMTCRSSVAHVGSGVRVVCGADAVTARSVRDADRPHGDSKS